MIDKGEVSKVSSIFYLILVCAVIISYIVFDDKLDIFEIIGIVIVTLGVTLINSKINFKCKK